ncbi:MAG: 50S ribosomal protein L6 [Chitinophagales bacterium]|nr:50S ribosomal protein L6 [Chitinophagales bacterium]MDW8394304.1 50S ribosomal protein L6 [Chitinophagales bacterium]
MSRIGKLPITLPKGVSVQVDAVTNETLVKGPKGELRMRFHPDIKVVVDSGVVRLERPTDQKRHKALHGLYRALLANMVSGVSDGFEKKLELVGVGYRAQVTGQLLELTIGFSHPVLFVLPKEIKATAEQVKGQNPIITLTSTDKQLLGQMAAKIRSVRKPEPYKGKGIKFVGEILRRKAGKSAATGGGSK